MPIPDQVYVFDMFDEVWVAFRGTQMCSIDAFIKDVTTDMHCVLKQTSYLPADCLVHTGFDESYVSVRNDIHDMIEGETNIRLIGHSLGGALATLLAADISQLNPILRTFGSPCVGNDSFVEFVNDALSDSKRFTIHLDPGL